MKLNQLGSIDFLLFLEALGIIDTLQTYSL